MTTVTKPTKRNRPTVQPIRRYIGCCYLDPKSHTWHRVVDVTGAGMWVLQRVDMAGVPATDKPEVTGIPLAARNFADQPFALR